jgi:hypothetical protein
MRRQRAQRDSLGQRPPRVARRHQPALELDARDRDRGAAVGIPDPAAESMQPLSHGVLSQVVEIHHILVAAGSLEHLRERAAHGEHVEQAPRALCLGKLRMPPRRRSHEPEQPGIGVLDPLRRIGRRLGLMRADHGVEVLHHVQQLHRHLAWQRHLRPWQVVGHYEGGALEVGVTLRRGNQANRRIATRDRRAARPQSADDNERPGGGPHLLADEPGDPLQPWPVAQQRRAQPRQPATHPRQPPSERQAVGRQRACESCGQPLQRRRRPAARREDEVEHGDRPHQPGHPLLDGLNRQRHACGAHCTV